MCTCSKKCERVASPEVFEAFVEMGFEEAKSPFLRPSSRWIGEEIALKSSLVAAVFLACAFGALWIPTISWISPIFLLWVYFLVGVPALIESIEDLCLLEINIDVLMTLAAFSSVLLGGAMEGGLLLVLFALSGALEEMVTSKAKGAIFSLKTTSPKKGYVLEDDRLRVKAVQDIGLDELVVVKTGEVVPLDGIIVGGRSFVSLVHLTGESVPQEKTQNDEVPAGARVVDGTLTLKVTRLSSDSTLSRIIALVTQAQEAKPKLQRFFERFSRTYALSIIAACAFFSLTLPYILGIEFLGNEGSLYRALAFLIAASPCALILAIPTAYLSAISACAKQGVMLKGGVALDAMVQCQTMAFDKTGTLTYGKLSFRTMERIEGEGDLEEALRVAISLEQGSKHPVALGFHELGEAKGISLAHVEDFQTRPGVGVEGKCHGKHAFLGTPGASVECVSKEGFAKLEKRWEIAKAQGFVSCVLVWNGQVILYSFEDFLREESTQVVQNLQQHMSVVVLTGDHRDNGERVGRMLGIDTVYSELSPQDKMEIVSGLADTQGLVMVGDGINDAPALARATVGVAMGKGGSGAALDAADIVLLQDRLDLLPSLVKKAAMTRRIVTQNLTLALTALILASSLSLMGLVPLWLAVVLHEGGTVLVGLNALRLLKNDVLHTTKSDEP